MIGLLAKRGFSGAVARSGQSVRTLYPAYHRTLMAPPRESIPFAEKAFWGVFMCVGILATPAWVLVHLEDYKTAKK